MSYVVVENTPGYLPDSDEPTTFSELGDAQRYAAEAAKAAISALYSEEDNARILEEGGRMWRIESDHPHDLGRVIEILDAEDVCSTCGAPDNCGDCSHGRGVPHCEGCGRDMPWPVRACDACDPEHIAQTY